MSTISRREILKTASILGAYGAAPFALNLLPFNALAASTTGYRALICIYLGGGMDCHDTILPYDQPSYDQYATLRRTLLDTYNLLPGGSSRTRDRLLPLNPTNAADFGGRQFAMPEALAPLHDLVSTGKAAIIGNVGPLIEPITRTQFRAKAVPFPRRLFSHNDQQSTWLAAGPEGARFGWGGQFADMAIAAGANADAAYTAISASGDSVFLVGRQTIPFAINSSGPAEIRSISRRETYGSQTVPGRISDLIQDAGDTRTNLFERDVASTYRRSIALNRDLQVAMASQPPFSTPFPDNNFARQLHVVARMIGARETLGVRRQVFFIFAPGYDTHSNQAVLLTDLHNTLSRSLRAFYNATMELGVENEVTTFTSSDFGRGLRTNGAGTDHGWGGHHFVIGGAVSGNRILGDIPQPELGHEMDSGNGRLIPGVAVEQYAASLAAWFGLSTSEIQIALPNLVNFSGPLDIFGSGLST